MHLPTEYVYREMNREQIWRATTNCQSKSFVLWREGEGYNGDLYFILALLFSVTVCVRAHSCSLLLSFSLS